MPLQGVSASYRKTEAVGKVIGRAVVLVTRMDLFEFDVPQPLRDAANELKAAIIEYQTADRAASRALFGQKD